MRTRSWMMGLLLLCVTGTAAAIGTTPPHATFPMLSAKPEDAGLVLTSWSSRDGLPAASAFISAGDGGIVMLASQGLLYRFDGAAFSAVHGADGAALRVEPIRTTRPGEHGEFWATTRSAEIFRVDAATTRRFGAEDGLPEGAEVRMVAAQDGRVLAATARGLLRLVDGRWQALRLQELERASVWEMRFDGAHWWLIVDSTLYRLDRTLAAIEPVATLAEDVNSGLVGNAEDGVWFWQSSGQHNLCRLGEAIRCYSAGDVISPEMDHAGILWWSEGSRVIGFDSRRALARADPDDAPFPLRVIETGQMGHELAVAPDGTLWLIVGGRLLRLAPAAVQQAAIGTGGLLPGPRDGVWVVPFVSPSVLMGPILASEALTAGADGRLHVLRADSALPPGSRVLGADERAWESRPLILRRFDDLPDSVVRADRMPDGTIHAATLAPSALWSFAGHGWALHSTLPLDKGAVVRGIARYADGRLVVGAARDRHGIHAFDGQRWHPVAWRGDGDEEEVTALHVDRHDALWIAHRSGTVTVLERDRPPRHHPIASPSIGPIRAFEQIDDDLWIVGMSGIVRHRDGRFEALQLEQRTPVSGITGLAIDGDGALWLGAAQGIVRIAGAQWAGAIGKPGRRARFTLLGELHGVLHPIASTAPLPSVAKAADGSLWFSTVGALYRLDPSRFRQPRPAPRIALTAFAADGIDLAGGDVVDVPAGARRLAFSFRRLDFTLPDAARYRYRIAGLDDAWRETSSSTLEIDRLPPGTYALELQASADDGAWTGPVVSQRFALAPTFWESTWAHGLLAALALLLVATLVLLRERRIRARHREIDLAQTRERERIARDIHDTLLQAVNGLMMTAQGALSRLERGLPAQEQLYRCLTMAERIVAEGRDRISALRTRDEDPMGLVRELELHAQDLAHERGIPCAVALQGQPRPLPPAIQDEMVQIGREALTNAFCHAKATRIALEIVYDADGVHLVVRDDGIGLQPARPDQRTHWGLHGMRERAAMIGATLDVRGNPAGGVSVELRVPTTTATPRQRGRLQPLWERVLRR